MGVNEIHVADVLTKFQVTLLQENGTVFPVNNANIMNFVFQKPDGSIITRNASYASDGLDGCVEYVTTSEDLDQPGLWKFQVFIAKEPLEKYSDISSFRVFPNLPLG